jgi:hypothetical protein
MTMCQTVHIWTLSRKDVHQPQNLCPSNNTRSPHGITYKKKGLVLITGDFKPQDLDDHLRNRLDITSFGPLNKDKREVKACPACLAKRLLACPSLAGAEAGAVPTGEVAAGRIEAAADPPAHAAPESIQPEQPSAERRLLRLKRFRELEYITDSEYKRKKEAILDEI